MAAKAMRVLRAALAAVLLGLLLPAFAQEAATQPARVQDDEDAAFATYDIDWVDARRQRAVPVRLYLPNEASAARPVPLVVFSHGIGSTRRGYSHLGRYWASHGMASLHVQHVGSDRSSVWLGNPFTLVSRLQQAAQETEAVARVQDLRFALDRLLEPGTPFAGRIDASRIAAAGHSYGANTVLLAAGASVQREGRRLDFRDPRIKAVVVMSAPPFYGDSDLGAILGPVAVPSLHVTGTDDVIRVPGYYSPASDRLAVFDAAGGTRKLLAVFQGASHMIFTDRAAPGGAQFNAQVKEGTRALSLAFMRSVLDGDEHALDSWPGPFADVVARFDIGSRHYRAPARREEPPTLIAP